ncbi:MAG: 3-deoxy-manno-octulosonate cytidylyltransferase [Planctomycetes bacterium]|nr:3-deoxy-manno-octulosonate cytidylyltransferase [Planctomycetota bacterium]
MRSVIVLPARLASGRLQEKLLLRESGKYLLQHTWEAACRATRPDRVVIACDDARIQAAAEEFGASALLTSVDHTSGTDRVAEAARQLAAAGESFDLVINVQGDEPELDPRVIDQLVELMEASQAPMGTLAEPLLAADLERPQVVKVVCDRAGRALYFSRSAIPSPARATGPVPAWRHVGIYAYRPEFLQTFCTLEPSPLEQIESLEQLRALWHGHAIQVGLLDRPGQPGIDTREDYEAFLARVASE